MLSQNVTFNSRMNSALDAVLSAAQYQKGEAAEKLEEVLKGGVPHSTAFSVSYTDDDRVAGFQEAVRLAQALMKQEGVYVVKDAFSLEETSLSVELVDTRGQGLVAYLGSGIGVNTSFTAAVYGNDQEEVRKFCLALQDPLQEVMTPAEDEEVDLSRTRVAVTNFGSCGIGKTMLTIHCPTWEEIRDNYVGETKLALDQLFASDIDDVVSRGKLLILHGDTGTGKTYIVRALIRKWLETHDPNIISDPAILFNSMPYYYGLVSDVSGRNIEVEAPVDSAAPQHVGSSPYKRPKRSRTQVSEGDSLLVVLEDTANALRSESREDEESSISRLLNMTDGLISEGRRDLFLVTFNEKLSKIDDAIKRPGRTTAVIEFGKFPAEVGRDWLAERGVDCEPPESSIAELYALLKKGDQGEGIHASTLVTEKRAAGF